MKPKVIITESLVKRFWEKTTKLGADECWLFDAYEEQAGHRRIWATYSDGKQRNASAHRVSLVLQGIELPDTCEVCHKCNNPPCVNPNHLYVGTRQTNAADVAAADTNKGENNGAHKLSAREARSIRWFRSIGMTIQDIGLMYDCDWTNVSLICANKTWTKAGGPDCSGLDCKVKITDDHKTAMRWLKSQGFKSCDISFMFGCSSTMVSNIVNFRPNNKSRIIKNEKV